MRRFLVAGAGYLGEEIARRLHGAGHEVAGLVRSPEKSRELGSYRILACDIADAASLAALEIEPPEAVIQCASSKGGGPEAYRQVYLAGARNLLARFPDARLVFAGSTSVYAQTDGAWVDENSPAEPSGETGRILRETEELVLGAGGFVARLAGIYGPGRAVLLRRFFNGDARIEGDGARWLNQIHRDDAAEALIRLASGGIAPGTYNVTDNEPATQREFYEWMAAHFKKPAPPVAEPDFNRKRGWTNRRVSNAKLRGQGWAPLHSSFREAILSDPRLVQSCLPGSAMG